MLVGKGRLEDTRSQLEIVLGNAPLFPGQLDTGVRQESRSFGEQPVQVDVELREIVAVNTDEDVVDVFLVLPVEIDHLADVSGDQQGQMILFEHELLHVDTHPHGSADAEKHEIGIQADRGLEFDQVPVITDVENTEIISEGDLPFIGEQFHELFEFHIVYRRFQTHSQISLQVNNIHIIDKILLYLRDRTIKLVHFSKN